MRSNQEHQKHLKIMPAKIILAQTTAQVVVTNEDDVVCNVEIDRDLLAPCNHEKADTHVVVLCDR